jgi:hypothetical protein
MIETLWRWIVSPRHWLQTAIKIQDMHWLSGCKGNWTFKMDPQNLLCYFSRPSHRRINWTMFDKIYNTCRLTKLNHNIVNGFTMLTDRPNRSVVSKQRQTLRYRTQRPQTTLSQIAGRRSGRVFQGHRK